MEYIKFTQNINKNYIKNPNEIPDNIRMIKPSSAWDLGAFGEGYTCGVIDTGIDLYHKDLIGQVLSYINLTSSDTNNVKDEIGHGTGVASIICGNLSGDGIVGVAPKSKLHIVKAITSKGGQFEAIIKGIEYCIEKKCDVINLSLGSNYNHPELEKIINKAVGLNISVVAASGNSGNGIENNSKNINYPAYYQSCISVGAVDINKSVANFSSENQFVDLVAPGKDCVVAYPNNRYVTQSGTSFAAPTVSGSILILKDLLEKEYCRKLNEAEIYSHIIKRTIRLGYNRNVEGAGMLYLGTENLLTNIIENNDLLKQLQS